MNENELIVKENFVATINLFEKASELKLDEKETEKLHASFDEKEIEIRPDGLIYLPQVFWRKRLNYSIGIGQWALLIKGSHKDPDQSKDKLYVEGVLMIRGCYVATAVGEAELHSSNPNQSWASVWESAKSDCITRCCKDIGIASELWQPEFIRNWIERYACQVWVQGKNKPQWRKKGAVPFYGETGFVSKTKDKEPAREKKEETIPGHWYAKLEKCKTPTDVDELGKKNADTINANPELRKLFAKRKSDLKKETDLPF